jgi:futalosine hydrolase
MAVLTHLWIAATAAELHCAPHCPTPDPTPGTLYTNPTGTHAYMVTGCGPYGGIQLMHALARLRPQLVLGIGIAGAYPGNPWEIADVVCIQRETLIDTGAESEQGFLSASHLGLPGLHSDYMLTIPKEWQALPLSTAATCATCTGTEATAKERQDRSGAWIENMEGAYWAMACELAQIPFAEVRAISNLASRRNRNAWKIPEALDALRTQLKRLGPTAR